MIIATRESALALWQANHVAGLLRKLYASCDVQLLGMTTRGDQILDRSLAAIGGKGLFIKELEQAIAEGRADLAVHSLKDVPMDIPDGFDLVAVMEREDPHDAFVSNTYGTLASLPGGAVVGTSSLRRQAAIKSRHPHLRIEPLRGNVGTRLRKLDEGHFDAIILAAAGLMRLGLDDRIRARLAIDDSLPAVGQGALGIEIADDRDDLRRALQPLQHADTSDCTRAEREFARRLSGSCYTPLAAYAQIIENDIRLLGFLGTPDGVQVLRGETTGARDDPEAVGARLAEEFMARGAAAILSAVASLGAVSSAPVLSTPAPPASAS